MTWRRAFDGSVALLGLVLFAPVLAVAAVAIKLEDGDDVFFLQERVGFGGKPFVIIKFRTMREGKVTRVGRWLRATALDEIVQFWNVLRGDMCIVGPRPLTVEDVKRLGWDAPAYQARCMVDPKNWTTSYATL